MNNVLSIKGLLLDCLYCYLYYIIFQVKLEIYKTRNFLHSCGGLILEFMVSRFENLTVFQPVINGVGGNLVAVQASRISTALHKHAEIGTLLIPPGHTHPVIFITPIANFFGKGIPS